MVPIYMDTIRSLVYTMIIDIELRSFTRYNCRKLVPQSVVAVTYKDYGYSYYSLIELYDPRSSIYIILYLHVLTT